MGLGPDLQQPCPFCHEIDRLELACPRCREPLAGETASIDRRMIAVIGSNAAGKSHYMATVLHQFLEGNVKGWEVRIEKDTLARCRRELLDPLFLEGRELPATPAVLGPDYPLRFEHSGTGAQVLLVFRDVGGDALLSPERLREMDFLHFADGVVLMVDPLAYQPPLDAPPEWLPHDKAPVTRALEVYREVLEQRRRLPQDRERSLLPQDKYLAVAVTKADLVLPDIHWFWQENGDSAIFRDGYWAEREMESTSVQVWIDTNLGLAMPRMTSDFADVSYFFVSSFGNRHQPGIERLGATPRPMRVHEPILALLDRMGEDLNAADEAIDSERA